LRLLILIVACGAFVAAFRKRAEIVHADVNRQSPKKNRGVGRKKEP
jgi:hypothetical protein